MGSIFNMFGPSPIRPIERHIRKAHQCAKQLHPFFEAVIQQNWQHAAEIRKKIGDLEREADKIKHELRMHLPTGLFLPVARTDLLALLTAQDRIANQAEKIAELIVSRKMQIPESLFNVFMSFLTCCLDASKQACQAINELDELLESGFRGSEVTIVEEMILTLDDIEQDSDKMLADIRQRIFALEKDYPPIEIFFLYQLTDWIAKLADHAQNVGALLLTLISR